MRKPTARQQLTHAAAFEGIPEAWDADTWILLSQCVRRKPEMFASFIIDAGSGVCLAARIDSRPLGEEVSSFLDCVVESLGEMQARPRHVITDRNRIINLGWLASWGCSRNVEIGLHPAWTIHHATRNVMAKFTLLLNSDSLANSFQERGLLALGVEVDRWRSEFNVSLHGFSVA
ncbi:hypothetical protein [Cupriavidus sp. TMH.W2]|uniref:hypothetical protein n=1 Tax=Cupriavidus sp. TMH.W2 TaxID=3434465 RepID=UPI003D770578